MRNVFKDWIKYLKICVSVKGWYFDNWNKQKCNPTFSCHLTSIVALLLIPPSYLHNYQVLKLVTHMNVAIVFIIYLQLFQALNSWPGGLRVRIQNHMKRFPVGNLGNVGNVEIFQYALLCFVLFNFWAFLCWITLFWLKKTPFISIAMVNSKLSIHN